MGVKKFWTSQKFRFSTIIIFVIFWTRGEDSLDHLERSMVISADIYAVLLRILRVLLRIWYQRLIFQVISLELRPQWLTNQLQVRCKTLVAHSTFEMCWRHALLYLTCAKGSFVVKVGCRRIDINENQSDFERNIQFICIRVMHLINCYGDIIIY